MTNLKTKDRILDIIRRVTKIDIPTYLIGFIILIFGFVTLIGSSNRSLISNYTFVYSWIVPAIILIPAFISLFIFLKAIISRLRRTKDRCLNNDKNGHKSSPLSVTDIIKRKDYVFLIYFILLIILSLIVQSIDPSLRLPPNGISANYSTYLDLLGSHILSGLSTIFDDLMISVNSSIIISILLLIAGIIIIKLATNLQYGFKKHANQLFAFILLGLATAIVLSVLGYILSILLVHGIGAINLEFLTGDVMNYGAAGGIFPCIVGTLYLVAGTVVIALILGVPTAIYLVEYANTSRLTRVINIAVNSLNGIPSIIFGLFGYAFLVSFFGRPTILAGWLLLGIMTVPTVIVTTEEALKNVPKSVREGSLAMGATKWQTIRKVVLPAAVPGIITGAILSIGRAAGETAPIMFTATVFFPADIPSSILEPTPALTYHLYELMMRLSSPEMFMNAWGTALVLIILVLGIDIIAIIIRDKYRKRIRW